MSNAVRALGGTYSQKAIEDIVESSFEHAARFWGESLFLRRRLAHQDWRKYVTIVSGADMATNSVDFPATFSRIRSQGRGLILTTAYLGNPAIAAVTWGRMLGKIHVVADFESQPMMKAWSTDLAGLPCVKIVERSEAATIVPKLLQNGGTIFMIGEHARLGRKGVSVQWLGREIKAYRTIGLLSARYDAVVLPVACTRNRGPFSFNMQVGHPIDPAASNLDPDVIVQSTVASLASEVMRTPEQYLWASWNSVASRASADEEAPARRNSRFDSGVERTFRR